MAESMIRHHKKMKMAQDYIEDMKANQNEEEIERELQEAIEPVPFHTVSLTWQSQINFPRLPSVPISVASNDSFIVVGCYGGDVHVYHADYHTKFALDGPAYIACNNRYLAVSNRKQIIIYDILPCEGTGFVDANDLLKQAKVLKGHRKQVHLMVFDDDILYSTSHDRCLKIWHLNADSSYHDTLFGHQDIPKAMDLLTKEKPISVGNRDRTTRVFNTDKSTQVIYRYERYCDAITAISAINSHYFVVGASSGALMLCHHQKKKPIHVIQQSHGTWEKDTVCGPLKQPMPISFVSVLKEHSVVATASQHLVKVWHIQLDPPQLTEVQSFPFSQFVTSLSLKKQLIVGLGRHPHDGQYERVKERNEIVTIPYLIQE